MGGGGSTDRRRYGGEGDGDDGDERSVPPPEEQDSDGDGPCVLQEIVTLDSPKPGPLNSVSVGDVLPVEIQQGAVVVVNQSGQAIGSIVEPWTADLKDCIEQGYDYEAEVKALQGGTCEVLLRNV